MIDFKDLKWVALRPTQEESEAGLYGERVDRRCVRMEVRILNTVTHGTHVAWSICERYHRLMVVGQIHLTPGLSPEKAFNEGKQRAVKFAELWDSLND